MLQVVVFDIDPVDEHGARVRIVEPVEQREDGRFASAGRTSEGDLLFGADLEREVDETRRVSLRVGELDVLELDFAADRSLQALRLAQDFVLDLHVAEDRRCCLLGCAQVACKLLAHAGAVGCEDDAHESSEHVLECQAIVERELRARVEDDAVHDERGELSHRFERSVERVGLVGHFVFLLHKLVEAGLLGNSSV